MADSRIRLATMVQQLREELAEAVRQGKGQEIQFELGDIELELQVVVSREGTGKLGFSVLGFEAGIGDKEDESRVQKLKLVLRPQNATGDTIHLRR
ncbi:MAG TPA: trypco2 family protein [Thermoanaerobaculia bacterium]|nr:trypco2 family protein [Thermoanaerobaculia bacterium]